MRTHTHAGEPDMLERCGLKKTQVRLDLLNALGAGAAGPVTVPQILGFDAAADGCGDGLSHTQHVLPQGPGASRSWRRKIVAVRDRPGAARIIRISSASNAGGWNA